MLKNITVSAIVALIVGSLAGFLVGGGSASVSNFGAIPTGDTVTNLQNFANDMRITGAPRGATTTLAITSPNASFGSCLTMNATSSATKIRVLFSTVSTSTFNGYVTWQYGTCETSGL